MNVYSAPKSKVAQDRTTKSVFVFLVMASVVLLITNFVGESIGVFHEGNQANFIKSSLSGLLVTLIIWLPLVHAIKITAKPAWLYLFSFLFGSLSIIILTVVISFLTDGNKEDLTKLLAHVFNSFDALIFMGFQWVAVAWSWLNRGKIFLTNWSK